MIHSIYDRDNAVDDSLLVARRETFLLAIAMQRRPEARAQVAAGRLRRALDVVQQLVDQLPLDRRVAHTQQKLRLVLDQAEGLLQAVLPPGSGTAPPENRDMRDADTCVYAHDTALANLDLDGLDLSRLWGYGCSLTNVTARHAMLEVAELASARLVGCDATESSFVNSTFDDATLEDCTLTRADLQRTSWRSVMVTRCVMQRVKLTGARLDGTIFHDCDLRGADFSVRKRTTFATTRSTRFVRCDLRETEWSKRDLIGVAFYDCKMFGAFGAPSLRDVVIERPDISVLGDGSQLGATGDVIAGWAYVVGGGVR